MGNIGTAAKVQKETGKSEVEIIINDVARTIHRGSQTVAEIKAAGNVPLADELAEVQGGKLTPLADDASVTIKGGERFVSYPRDSGSSE